MRAFVFVFACMCVRARAYESVCASARVLVKRCVSVDVLMYSVGQCFAAVRS